MIRKYNVDGNAEPMLFINILYVFVGENWKMIFLARWRKFQY